MPESLNKLVDLLQSCQVIDLTQTMEENMPVFPSHSKFFLNRWLSPGDPALVNVMIMGDHAGTHFDAPAHFVHDENDPVRQYCDEVAPLKLVGHALKLTFGPFFAENCTVSAADIMAWEAAHLPIQADDIVIFDYQWEPDKWKTVEQGNEYMGNWPGLSESAAEYLIAKQVRVVGCDCASIDAADGDGGKFPGHLGLLFKGILLVENLKNLQLLPTEFLFMALPLKIKRAGGSPIRAVALIPRA